MRFHLDFTDEEKEFDFNNLFIILKYLDYARLRDEAWVATHVFPIFASIEHMSWSSLKLLLCAIEGIYLPGLFSTIPIRFPTFAAPITDQSTFTKLHLFLQPLFINRNQIRYLNREKDLDMIRQ